MRLLTSSPAVELHSLCEWIVVLKFCCLLGNNVLFLLNVTEDQPTGPLSFRERLFVIRVSTLFYLFDLKLFSQTVTELDFCEQGLWKFVLQLGVVYLTEYFINQGLVSPLMPSSSTLSSLHAVSETWLWFCVMLWEYWTRNIFSLSVRWNSCSSTIFSWPMQLSIAGQWSITESIQYEWLHADCLGCAALLVSCLHPQVSDSVPAWCTALSILSALCEDQESVDSQWSAGEKWE